jgi:hypothetical protein
MSWGWGALALPHVLRLRAEGATSVREKTSLILLWQDGGPSHFETFDPKPDAPSEIRGELSSIATSLPGVRFCEILPRLAGLAHKFSVIRSLHQPSSNHVSATRVFITGHPTTLETGVPKNPDLGSVIHRVRSSRLSRVPHYVALKDAYAAGLHRGGTAYLGSATGPFIAEPDPQGNEYRVSDLQRDKLILEERFQSRLSLRDSLNRLPNSTDAFGQMTALDKFHNRATELLQSADAQRAFDLAQEAPAVRERYGRNRTGQQALLARRLVEAGVDVVAVRFSPECRGDDDRGGAGWDDHAIHGNIFQLMRRRGPRFDQALSALIQDLGERGLNDRVLVVVAGEFGRTPRIEYSEGMPGRDHWGPAGCALVYGGGLRMGQVVGATTRKGEFPIQSPTSPQDLLATIYRFLHIDPTHNFQDHNGRPVPILPFGRPIPELI